MSGVFLVRHGQTDWNRERRFQGHIDIELNTQGQNEAERLGLRLEVEGIAAIYTSDLVRAEATAQPLARRVKLPIVALPGLKERHYGIFEGLTPREIALRHPREHGCWSSYDPGFVIPEGESQDGFRDRILAAIDALIERHRGEEILIVTHGGALDMVYRRCLGLPWNAPRTCPVPNAALNLLATREEKVQIRSWADTLHLEPDWPAWGAGARS